MKRLFTQKEIYDYLVANPLSTNVHVGALEDMNGNDYIFINYMDELPTLHDDDANYQSLIQISVLTKDFENRKTLVNYIKKQFIFAPNYSRSDEGEYYQAQGTIGVFIYEQDDGLGREVGTKNIRRRKVQQNH